MSGMWKPSSNSSRASMARIAPADVRHVRAVVAEKATNRR